MLNTRYFLASASIGAVGAAALLAAHSSSLAATPEPVTERNVQLAAQPFALSLSRVFPWAVGPSAGAATLSALADAGDPAAAAASAALQTANQFGPLAFGLNSIRAVSANQSVPGTNNTVANVTSMDQWVAGLAGVASSTGVVGFTEDAAQYDPFMANHAGVLQTANQFGPAVFDLNVLKAIGFFQAPSGTVLASGYPDNVSAVDIGRWRAGIPGFIMNTGTTGFVDYADMGPGPVQASASGGLHTTTQIGSTTYDFNVLPTVGAGVMPYGFSFTMAPDLTADDTPFAPSTPPPPGVIVPPAASAPAPLAAAAPAAEPEDVSVVETARTTQREPKPVIPGVNGAPLATTPKTGAAGGPGGAALDPFRPLKPFSDMINSGISAFTGTKPASGGSDAGSGDSGGGTGGGSESGE